jgi:RNA polymerase sigma-70 factor (ECF subfamily)
MDAGQRDTVVAEPESTLTRERERQLVRRARAGDRQALRELVNLHKDRLFAFVWRMVRNHHEAEDVCQDAFLKAFASLDSFSSEYRFSTWLFTIGYRVCLNRLRRQKPVSDDGILASIAEDRTGGAPDVFESEEAAHVKDLVWSTVDRLTPPQRAAVLLFYRHELSCQDISRIVQLPLATVKSHLHRARARLRVMLESISDQDLSRIRNLSGLAG